MTCKGFLESLAEARAIPGGGAAAAYGASVGLALLEKIARLEAKRHAGIAESEAFWEVLLARLMRISGRLAHLRDEDGRAYATLAESRKISGSGSEFYYRALRYATEVPMEIMKEVPRALACAKDVGGRCKGHLLSDLLAACELLSGGSRGASCIVEANLRLFADRPVKESLESELHRIKREVLHCLEEIRELALSRLGPSDERTTKPKRAE